ncbi:hypothetical protein SLE2022_192500 [Rubroshorea leprosula]
MTPPELYAFLASTIGSLMLFWPFFRPYLPYSLQSFIQSYCQRWVGSLSPYVHVTFHEFIGERLMRNEAHSAIQNYLSSSSSMHAKRLRAEMTKSKQSLILSMDDYEEITDEFEGAKLWWYSGKSISNKQQPFSLYPFTDEKRHYKLTFHKQHRDLIIGPYLDHVLKEGKEIEIRKRQRKMYMNHDGMWSSVVFEHPTTFETLAMEPGKKQEIMEDLISFSKAEELYARIGKAWKRGYLLYGPPGTGKSSMIAAMANLLNYDIYELELTGVKDNTELRRLLMDVSNKSVMVIEDIDCSLDLTNRRKTIREEEEEEMKDPKPNPLKDERDSKSSRVTLSGLLNSIDGLWSAYGGERIIVFTTNHVAKLDPALIRDGRMDKYIEMSYCGFEGFKVLANRYLKLESHHLFSRVGELLPEAQMTPAKVAGHLMPKTISGDAEICLESLIKALELVKETAGLKAEKEAK